MVSHHLQILHRATLATRTKHGSRVYHQINDYALEVVARDLTSPQGLAGPSRSPSAYENPADLQQRPPLAGSSPWTVPLSGRRAVDKKQPDLVSCTGDPCQKSSD
jgi:hypothetical protein